MTEIIKRISDELNTAVWQVEAAVNLIDEKNTIPFIARYRKEVTGNLDDQVLRDLSEKLEYYRALYARKEEVHRLIESQGNMTVEIEKSLIDAKTLNEIEDIYRPFRPKRKTRASIAIEKGLDGFAKLVLEGKLTSLTVDAQAQKFLSDEKGVFSFDDVIQGAMDVIAEWISDDAELRKRLRGIFFNTGLLTAKAKKKESSVYDMYYDFNEPVKRIAGHRVLAINRGEKEEFLQVSIDADNDFIKQIIYSHANASLAGGKKLSEYCSDILNKACDDSWKRLIEPSIETETRNRLTEEAEEKAIDIFAVNLRSTILQPPVKGKNVLGFDPAYRTGCKLAVVDQTGKCLETAVIYPHMPVNKKDEAEIKLLSLLKKHNVDVIAIGNGTASGESEKLVADIILKNNLKTVYCMVNEAGASVYSASKLGADEFPDFDVSLRSAVSIARRLQDPLAELVKIDPKSIGVGQYQHDMNQKRLESSLGGVVEDCVNLVGVDLNTASPSLLSYVSGISGSLAKSIVEFRNVNGEYKSRSLLKKVPKLGPKAFEQCAGFLRIPGASEYLDNTPVHPESYEAVKKIMKITGVKKLSDNESAIAFARAAEDYGLGNLAKEADVGVLTLNDIVEAMKKPGRDPRGDDFEVISQTRPIDISELHEGMMLDGIVRNVSAFGAFVDIGVHQDGLVHISQLSDSFIKDPSTVVKAGQKVKVRIIGIEIEKKRISLSMKGIG